MVHFDVQRGDMTLLRIQAKLDSPIQISSAERLRQ